MTRSIFDPKVVLFFPLGLTILSWTSSIAGSISNTKSPMGRYSKMNLFKCTDSSDKYRLLQETFVKSTYFKSFTQFLL